MSGQPLCDRLSALAWRIHGSAELHIFNYLPSQSCTIIPSSMVNALTNGFQWRLLTILFLSWHIKIIHKYYYFLPNIRPTNTLFPVSELGFYRVLYLITSHSSTQGQHIEQHIPRQVGVQVSFNQQGLASPSAPC